jgi:hypothetical protein
MKTELSPVEWQQVNDKLAHATVALADLASLLEMSSDTERVSDEAKSIEMDLNVLESRLRRIRRKISTENASKALYMTAGQCAG